MKKIVLTLLILISLLPYNIYASERKEIKYKSCIDGDTSKFIMDNKEITVRFLAVDTPETKHPKKGEEPYGKEAKDFTCNYLKNAKKIEIEFDDNSTLKDKYDRYLGWIFYDDYLLQAELVKNGLAEVKYLYGDYKYTPMLQDYEENARINKVGMYSDIDNSYYTKHKNDKIDINKYIKKLKASIYKMIDEFLEEFF